jgi:hypothetical protein
MDAATLAQVESVVASLYTTQDAALRHQSEQARAWRAPAARDVLWGDER